MKSPQVSIITPMFNASAYLEATIESVVAQSMKSWEMIIVDDASTDGGASLKIARRWQKKDVRITVIAQKQNGGSARARNEGLRCAKGRFIALLDSDDLWDKDYLKKQLAFMKEKDAALVAASFRRIDENSKEILFPVICRGNLSYKSLLITNDIGCVAALYDSKKTGGIQFLDESLGSVRDDYELWLRIVKMTGPAFGSPEVLASYRIHSSSTTKKKYKMILPQWRIYYRYEKLGALRSLFYLFSWALFGLLKYRRKSAAVQS